MLRIPRLIFLAAVVGAGLMAPAAAQASPDQISIMMDDDLLVYRDDNTAARTLTQMKSLGVDTVRVTVLWKVVGEFADPTAKEIKAARTPSQRSALRAQKRRFKPSQPGTYPIRNWDRYDNLVKKANELGIQIYFNVTGPGPSWAHAKAPKSQSRNQPTWKPKAEAYKAFVAAVGRRYNGIYKDENASQGVLPRVKFWSFWNEPNQAGWLSPQWERKGSQMVPTSPALYRKLHQYGYRGLAASGHTTRTDIVLMAETAPLGSGKQTSRSPMYPGKFLRELACVDDSGAKYTGTAASRRDCGAFAKRGPILANGYAHHPYTKNVAPTVKSSRPDALTMANITDLGTTLDRLSVTSGGMLPNALPLFMTEFGFESNPPDPFSGVPLDKQAKFNVLGEHIGYLNPRIAGMAQFILRDVPPVKGKPKKSKSYWFTYQSGLFFTGGSPKPAAFAYTMPFLVFPQPADPATGNKRASFWGQLRFLPNGQAGGPAPGNVIIQWRPQGNSQAPWTSVAELPVDKRGFYSTNPIASPSPELSQWRAIWNLPNGQLGQTSLGENGN